MTNNVQKDKIRVLIVDDSIVSQRLYKGILAANGNFEVVATANNGQDAIALTKKHMPDVISMDINMPVLNGVEATKVIMSEFPVPILIVSSLYDTSNLQLAMEVLEAGAVGIISKPNGPTHPRFKFDADRYKRNLKRYSEAIVQKKAPKASRKTADNQKNTITPIIKNTERKDYEVLVIGASAGGPQAMKTILGRLGGNFSLPILIVQHIDANFISGYIDWLQTYTSVKIEQISDEQALKSGHAYFSSNQRHLVLSGKGLANLSDAPDYKGHKPSVKELFESAALTYGDKTIAVLLSGMGNDGANELKTLKEIGALTIAQDKESSLVYGMPGEAEKIGAVCYLANPEEIVEIIYKNINL